MRAPKRRMPSIVAKISSENATFSTMLRPSASAAQMMARCAMLLDGGTFTRPESSAGCIVFCPMGLPLQKRRIGIHQNAFAQLFQRHDLQRLA